MLFYSLVLVFVDSCSTKDVIVPSQRIFLVFVDSCSTKDVIVPSQRIFLGKTVQSSLD